MNVEGKKRLRRRVERKLYHEIVNAVFVFISFYFLISLVKSNLISSFFFSRRKKGRRKSDKKLLLTAEKSWHHRCRVGKRERGTTKIKIKLFFFSVALDETSVCICNQKILKLILNTNSMAFHLFIARLESKPNKAPPTDTPAYVT